MPTVAAVGSVMILGPVVSPRPEPRPASGPFTVITRTGLPVSWGPVSGMAAVPGGVWLSSWMQGQLVRIDAATGQITARLRVGRPQDGVYAIAYGAGSLWVVDVQTSDLLRLDPVTGRQQATVHLPGLISEVAVGGGFVWVSEWGHADGSWYRLAKVSPVTGRLAAQRAIPGNFGPGGLTIAASAGGVWVHADGGPSVQAVDPASLRLLGSTRTGGEDLAAAGPRVWALSEGTLSRIDPPWTTVARRVRLYPNPASSQNFGFQTLAAGAARTLWAAGPALYRIDETTMRAKTINRFGRVDDVSVIGQTLWVQTEDQFGYHQFVYQLTLTQASSPPPA
jgi:hypothetical protein